MVRGEDSTRGRAGCVLIDLAEAGPGHWVEDGVYLERLFWGRPGLLHGVEVLTEGAPRPRQLLEDRIASGDPG